MTTYIRPLKQIIDGVVYDVNGKPIDDELEDDVVPDRATVRIALMLQDSDDEDEDDADDDHDESTGDAMPMTLDAILPSRRLLVLSPASDGRQRAYDARVERITNAWRKPPALPAAQRHLDDSADRLTAAEPA